MAVLFAIWIASIAIGACAQQSTITLTRKIGGGVVTSTTIRTITTPPPAPPAATHTINVGASGHKFTPEETDARVGDVIEYRFYPAEHWIIRGDFDHPCIPYEYVDTNRKGFSSGPQPVNAITDDAPRYQVRVNDSEPIFFYCGAPGSCITHHMMGVINPKPNMTLADYLNKAKDVEYQLRPGEPWPTEGSEPPKPSSTPALEVPPANNDRDDNDRDNNNLGNGEIVGISVGAAGVLVLAIAAFFLVQRHRTNNGISGAYGTDQERRSFNTTGSAYPGSPRSPMAEAWSHNKFNFGRPGDTNQRQSSPMPTLQSQISPPISPGSMADAYHYQYPGVVGLAPNGTIGPYFDPRFQPLPQYMSYAAQKVPAQESQAPVELPTSPHPPQSLEREGESGAPRFSWKEGPEILSRGRPRM